MSARTPALVRALGILAALIGLILVAGCGAQTDTSSGATTQSTPTLGTADSGTLRVSLGWVAAVSQRQVPDGATSASPPDEHGQHKQTPDDQAGGRHTMGTMSAGYAVIENTGDRGERLVGASSPAAKEVQIHQTVSTGGSAGTMKPVDQLKVPAGDRAVLEPGGYHLMIMGLEHGLQAGSSIRINLKFASGTQVAVRFAVIDRADRPTMSPDSR